MATWNIMLKSKEFFDPFFLKLKALENAFGGVSSKAAITNILHGGQDGSCVPVPAPQEAGDAISPWKACCNGARACLAAALLRAETTGRARPRWAALIPQGPLVNGEKEETGPHTGGDFFPKRWMRGLNATLARTSWCFSG